MKNKKNKLILFVIGLAIAVASLLLLPVRASLAPSGYLSIELSRLLANPAYPSVVNRATGRTSTTNTNKHEVTLPSVTEGNLLLTVFSVDNNPTVSPMSPLVDKADLPVAAADLPGVVANGKLYIFGGYGTDDNDELDDTQVYDPSTNSWDTLDGMPTPRWGASATYYDGNIYVYGGVISGGGGGTGTNKCEIYNISGDSWTTGTNIPATWGDGSHAITVGDYIYLFYGSTVYRFDPSGNGGAGSYTSRTNAPVSRYWGCVAYVNVGGEDRIYHMGGSTGGWPPTFSTTNYYFRPDSNDWSSAQAAVPYESHGVNRDNPVYNGKIYYGLGWNYYTTLFTPYIYEYDPTSNTWSAPIAITTHERDGHACGVIDGMLYLAGGRDQTSSPYGLDYLDAVDLSDLWSKLGQDSYSTTVSGAIFYKVASGNDAMTVYSSTSQQSSHVTLEISGSSGLVTGSSVTGSSTNSNPPNHDAGDSNEYLWIATRSGDSTVNASAEPSGYSNLTTINAAGTRGASSATAEYQSEASSEDPGTFTSNSEQWVCWTIAVEPAVPTEPDISNTPSSKNFGGVDENSTYYFKGTAPNNPVQSGDCTFSVTNSSEFSVDLYVQVANWSGGGGWTIVSGSPGPDQARETFYYVGINPSSGTVATTSAQLFYSGLVGSASLGWDGKLETGTFGDGSTRTQDIVISAQAS